MDLFRRRRIEGHIDMTPMIDTLLQLFLIFMVGSTMASSSIDLDLPRAKLAATTSREQPRVVIVAVDAANRIYLDGRLIPRNRLRADLLFLEQDSGELTVHLQADRRLRYEQVIQAMVEIRKAGVTRISLAYINQERSP